MVFFIQRANLQQKLHIRKHSGIFRPIKCNFLDFVPIYSGYACIRRYIWVQNTKAVRLDEKYPPLRMSGRWRTALTWQFERKEQWGTLLRHR